VMTQGPASAPVFRTRTPPNYADLAA
jgi:hypothetical protein